MVRRSSQYRKVGVSTPGGVGRVRVSETFRMAGIQVYLWVFPLVATRVSALLLMAPIPATCRAHGLRLRFQVSRFGAEG